MVVFEVMLSLGGFPGGPLIESWDVGCACHLPVLQGLGQMLCAFLATPASRWQVVSPPHAAIDSPPLFSRIHDIDLQPREFLEFWKETDCAQFPILPGLCEVAVAAVKKRGPGCIYAIH